MDRRAFLKLFGVGAAAAVVAPQLLAPEPHRRIWQVGFGAPRDVHRAIDYLPTIRMPLGDELSELTFDVENIKRWLDAEVKAANVQAQRYFYSVPITAAPTHSVLITGIAGALGNTGLTRGATVFIGDDAARDLGLDV